MSEPISIDSAREKFGDEVADGFVVMVKAVRALVSVGTAYNLAEEDSHEEKVAGDSLEKMLNSMQDQPDKQRAVIISLLSMIAALREGTFLPEWFHETGVELTVLTEFEQRVISNEKADKAAPAEEPPSE